MRETTKLKGSVWVSAYLVRKFSTSYSPRSVVSFHPTHLDKGVVGIGAAHLGALRGSFCADRVNTGARVYIYIALLGLMYTIEIEEMRTVFSYGLGQVYELRTR